MVDFLPEHHEAICRTIDRFLDQKKVELSLVNSWGADLCTRLKDFTSSGKMLRGKLVLLSYLMYRDSLEDAVLDTAAAIELFHSSLLIHDDIIDSDLLRRGHPTLFAQYQKWGEDHGLLEPSSFGQSMGICAGDVGFILSFEILSRLNADLSVINKLLQLYSQEMTYVGIAQMQDIFFASSNSAVDEASVYNLYIYKTGRYTFSLPMMAGASSVHSGSAMVKHPTENWKPGMSTRSNQAWPCKDMDTSASRKMYSSLKMVLSIWESHKRN